MSFNRLVAHIHNEELIGAVGRPKDDLIALSRLKQGTRHR